MQRTAWVMRAAQHIEKANDFEKFLAAMSNSDEAPESSAHCGGIRELMCDIGSF
jgi:hypothetical protein